MDITNKNDIHDKLILAGPCSVETETQLNDVANQLIDMGIPIMRAGVWKPRTKPGCFEGVGVKGLRWLKDIKDRTGIKIAIEVANEKHVYEALKYGIDYLWIGARTTTNPFAVQEIADALKGAEVKVFVKNPMNPDIELWIGALERINNAGISQVGAIHRGFSSYHRGLYRNPPQWHIPIELKRRYPKMTIICDPSHIGGKRDLIEPISKLAMNLGFNGLMIETHCNPDTAWSDSEQQITPEQLKNIIDSIEVRNNNVSISELFSFRNQIDEIDYRVIELFNERVNIAYKIGLFKKERKISALQIDRYQELLNNRVEYAQGLSISKDFIMKLFEIIHEESVRVQSSI